MAKQKGQQYTANAEIRAMMKKKGVTQPQLSKTLGISVATLNSWLKSEMPDNLRLALEDTLRGM